MFQQAALLQPGKRPGITVHWTFRMYLSFQLSKCYKLGPNAAVQWSAGFFLLSALPEDHPPGYQTLQPAAGRWWPREDSGLWGQQPVWRQRRFTVQHRRHSRFYGSWDPLRHAEELQRESELAPPNRSWRNPDLCRSDVYGPSRNLNMYVRIIRVLLHRLFLHECKRTHRRWFWWKKYFVCPSKCGQNRTFWLHQSTRAFK